MDRRTARTREALLDAAEELFSERGFSAVGNRELVALAGVNLAAIQYHFGSKLGLYLETVRRAGQRPEVVETWRTLEECPEEPVGAARALVSFLRLLTSRLLADRELSACTRLMLREALRPSEALPDVVVSFTRPHEELLVRAIRRVAPGLGPREARLASRSLLGQVFHHHLFRPFFEQERGEPYDEGEIRSIADHVARFSLRGLGLPSRRVESALREPTRPRSVR